MSIGAENATPTDTPLSFVSTLSATSVASNGEETLHSQELASSSSITTYYNGGMGLYNQQRGSGGGISLLNGGVPGLSNGHGASGGSTQNYAHVVNGSVNLLLGGSMLCLVTTILCVVCYCCHRNIKKRTEAAYRQQHHQWMENDPNMEIYSVEQCYETSGLFLSNSTDGLATISPLHHEPPPSYDAVVLHEQQLLQQQQRQLEEQQLQLQQQQFLLQRVSPPPGYSSTLDTTNADQLIGISTADSSGNCVAGNGSCSSSTMGAGLVVNKQLQCALNVQSCCSLQRAEVESMWNAATAAVVARNGHSDEIEACIPTPSPLLPLSHQHCKNTQPAIRLNSFGRRYLHYSQQHQHHQSHYRSGCPLCGKFLYTTEDDTLTASVDSALEDCDVNENFPSAENHHHDHQQERHLVQQQTPAQDSLNETCSNVDADVANGNVVNSLVKTTLASHTDNDEIDNAASSLVPALSGTESTSPKAIKDSGAPMCIDNDSSEVEESNSVSDIDINNINGNGIISLDMSKIIDLSGLPTYEGALKLESSGYV